MYTPITIFWFRRDLRLFDNRGLFEALHTSDKVMPLFIFDTEVLDPLPRNDHRVTFIYDALMAMQQKLQGEGRGMMIKQGNPLDVFVDLLDEYYVDAVHCNVDHEPYGQKRDEKIKALLDSRAISFYTALDHLIYDKNEMLKADGTPYKVFTPYSLQWKSRLKPNHLKKYPSEELLHRLVPISICNDTVSPARGNPSDGLTRPTDPESIMYQQLPDDRILSDFPNLVTIGFKRTKMLSPVMVIDEGSIRQYDQTRNFPALDGTSRLGVHLRFGTLSIRELVGKAAIWNEVFLNELIWREFYAMILWHFPHVVERAFKSEYDRIIWRNDHNEFDRWTKGLTGYPMVDAGMRQLNATGYMHNRLRMVTASFLTKHLLIDWRLGEAYFAQKLFDFELSSNNGGWQWSAGTGCDAAPYFRIFNPIEQQKKFDTQGVYVKQWIPELNTMEYPDPLVDHKKARERCLQVYKDALG